MNYTPSSKIEECEIPEQLGYDYLKQIIPIDMRTIGTKSLRPSRTQIGPSAIKTDNKNEIDDQKTVR